MKNNLLHKQLALRASFFLLLWAAGMAKAFAYYDFPKVCSTGQTLYYTIIDATNHYVEISLPGNPYYPDPWQGYTKPTGMIALPSRVTYNGISYTVTSIGAYAFEYCNGLTGSLTIPDSVTAIGEWAFYNCSGFTGSLSIPNSVTTIGTGAFCGCNGFTGSLILPDSVTSIGINAFNSCSGFTGSLTLPGSITTIADNAFNGCSGFTGSLIIPNSVTTVGYSAFSYCSGFTGSLTLGSSVTVIGDNAFSFCSGFTGINSLVVTPPSLGYEAFYGVNHAIPVMVPCGASGDYQSASGWNTFTNWIEACPFEITAVADPVEGGTIDGAGTYIRNETCTLIATTSLGYNFVNWTRDGSEVSTDETYSFVVTEAADFVAHFEIIDTDPLTYEINADGVSVTVTGHVDGTSAAGQLFIPEAKTLGGVTYTVTAIGDYAFIGCSGLTGSLTLPNSVTTIGDEAFEDCNGFTGSLTLSNSLTTIGNRAFIYCTGFSGDLTLPNSVTTIGYQAFDGCTGFTGSLTLSNSLTTIGGNAFADCIGFTGINLLAVTPPTLLYGDAFWGVNHTIPVTVPCGALAAYQGASGWDEFTNWIETCTYEITANADPAEGGTITGAGTYIGGENCTLTATPSMSYTFLNWTKDGSVVSTDASYTFIVAGTSTYVAHFELVDSDPLIYSINSDGVSVTVMGHMDGYAATGTLTIPATKTLDGVTYTVTAIGDEAFDYCDGFTGILTIPNTVTMIGNNAFEGCTGFTGLVLPNSLTRIKSRAFFHCTGFTGSLAIPDSVTIIGDDAFSGCTGFTGTLTLGESVTTIESGAFSGCGFFTGSLIIPNSVTSIGASAFNGCTGFSGSLTLSSQLTSIASNAFKNCVNLTGNLIVPNSVLSVGWGAFRNCRGFTGSLTLSESVTTIGNEAFVGCSGFTGSLTLGESVTTIGYQAFDGCSGFTDTLTIGSAVATIGNAAFQDCSGFTAINSLANDPPALGSNVFYGVDHAIPVMVPCYSLADYEAALGWGGFTNLIPACPSYISVSVDPYWGGIITGEGLSENYGGEFGGIFNYGESCTMTATANLACTFVNWTRDGNVVSTDATYTFTVTEFASFVAHFERVGDGDPLVYALNDDGVSVTVVGHEDGTAATGTLTIPETKTIGGVTYTVTAIGDYAFVACSGLTGSLTIPNTVTTIGKRAFYQCNGFTGNLTIPNSVTTIGSLAFIGCSGFTGNLTIGNSVTTIGGYAFSGCSGFTGSLTLGNSVTMIGERAFYDCSGFTSINSLAVTPPTLYDYVFVWVNHAIPVTVPCNTLGDYQGASGWNGFTNWMEECTHHITATAEPSGGGTISGAGTYGHGENCTLTATANIGYSFVNWTKDGSVVSSDASYTFTVNASGAYVAHFERTDTDPLTYAINSDGVSVTVTGHVDGTAATGTLTIPETKTFDGVTYTVTAIGVWAFYGCGGFTGDLTIPNSVTTIGHHAFDGCSGFTGSLTIPNSVTTIGTDAFRNCTGFTGSLTIPNSVTEIGYYAFTGCSGFTGSLTIPDSVTTIGEWAFFNCSGFTGSLTISNSVTAIEENAFAGCSGFTGSLTIPNSVTAIGLWAFYGCSGLTGSLTLGNSVTMIDVQAFSGCSFTAINSLTMIPPAMGFQAFSGVNHAIPVTVPCGSLGDYQGASGWNEFTNWIEACSHDVTATASPAEGGMVSGTGTYDYGASCTLTATANIGYSFVNWTKDGSEVSTDASYTFTVTEDADFVAHFERTDTDPLTYAINSDGVSVTVTGHVDGTAATGTLTIPETKTFDGVTYTVTAIGVWAFYGCGGFTGDLTIPNTVTTIGVRAFEGCSGFTGSLTIPNTVTTIEEGTFFGCDGLTGSLTIPNSVTTIGDYAFYGCSGLTGSLTIPNSVTTIGFGAFQDCSGFTGNLTIGNSVTMIQDYAFQDCSGFTGSLTLGNSLTTIGESAFESCSGFTGSLTIPDSVTTIGNYAFCQCSGFTGGLTIGNSVTTIGEGAFYDCSGFTGSLTIGNSVTTIREGAFYNCSGFTGDLTIPNSVTTIGFSAFYRCRGFTGSLTLGESVTEIGDTAFYHCSGFTSINSLAVTPPTLYYGVFLDMDHAIPVTVPCGSLGAYQSASGWSMFTNWIEACSHDVTATASPAEGGTVSGAGTFTHGASCTLTATPATGYSFVNWTEGGAEVSTEASYTFTVTTDRTLVANFSQSSYTVTVAANPAEGGSVSQSGSGTYDIGATVTLTATPSSGYTFLYWTANGAMLSTSSSCTFTVTSNTDCVARFYSGDANLEIDPFTSGWNWYSTYIEQGSIDGLAQLEESLGSSGIQIKSQQQYVNYYEGMGWMGMLSSINNESTYKIKTSAPCVVEMIGEETTSAAHPITIGPGWNWIGYPVNASMSITDALSGIEPSNGDQLKAQNGYANYYEGMGWMGTLSTITPSMGLLYKSYGSGAFTLVYPTGTKGETLVENITSENNHWVPDMHAYPDNMTVTAVVELDDNELQSDHYELAAFANGECRGSVRLMYVAPIDRHIAFLTLTGEEVETLDFSLYDTTTGEEIHGANEQINFSNNAIVGDLWEPYVIHFRGTMGVNEWASNIHVFPNPVSRGGKVNLGTTVEISKVKIEIVNALGVVVETVYTPSLQMITAPRVAGVYTLRITAEGKGTCYRKLIVR